LTSPAVTDKSSRAASTPARRSTSRTPRASSRRARIPLVAKDPVAAAREARLRYVNDDKPGIRRVRAGKHFSYRDPDGRPIRDPQVLGRIRALAIPPAWTDVWICLDPAGHIQATGRDAKGRKQYRYHARFREVRDSHKYERTIAFAEALPRIRAAVNEDLSKPGLSRRKVVAAVVRLLERTQIRVGNEEYARENRSYGLTTLRDRHVAVDGSEIKFKFRGKSGKDLRVGLRDRRLARIVRRCQDLPGQQLFQYRDDDGDLQAVDSDDVNEYLREVTGEDFTAKDFRTWAGTLLAAQALQAAEAVDDELAAKKAVVRAIESVAEDLGNTPSVCRSCYVHPAIIDSYMDGELVRALKRRAEQEMAEALDQHTPEEAAVLALLQARLAAKAEAADAAEAGDKKSAAAAAKAAAALASEAGARA
jgi:DNA topoisomerase-1